MRYIRSLINEKLNPTKATIRVSSCFILFLLLCTSCHVFENLLIGNSRARQKAGYKIRGVIRDYDTNGIIKDAIVYPVHVSEPAKNQNKYKTDILGYFEFEHNEG